MTLAAILAFLVCFVLGPTLCALLTRLPARLPALLSLGVVSATAMLFGLRLQSEQPLVALGLMWLAWVLVISMFAMALLKRISDPRLGRWVTVGALLATTLPWFGLATAEMMV